jgi:hypothetical protein
VKRLLAGVAFGASRVGPSTAAILSTLEPPVTVGLAFLTFGEALGAVHLVGALAVLGAVLATRQAFPLDRGSTLAAALEHDPREPLRPRELERLEREVTLGTSTAFDLHYRLRPILREVAEQRLLDRRGLRLERGGREVEDALGEELWELVRPGRKPPEKRYARGLAPEAVRRVVERLEAV